MSDPKVSAMSTPPGATAAETAAEPEASLVEDALRRFRRLPFLVSVDVGSGKMKIRDLLVLRHHSVIELKRPAGGPLDISVNGVLLGKGEPVIHEGRAGVQIHEILEIEN
jgi:flagellar motor switch protein FliN/FliY